MIGRTTWERAKVRSRIWVSDTRHVFLDHAGVDYSCISTGTHVRSSNLAFH